MRCKGCIRKNILLLFLFIVVVMLKLLIYKLFIKLQLIFGFVNLILIKSAHSMPKRVDKFSIYNYYKGSNLNRSFINSTKKIPCLDNMGLNSECKKIKQANGLPTHL